MYQTERVLFRDFSIFKCCVRYHLISRRCLIVFLESSCTSLAFDSGPLFWSTKGYQQSYPDLALYVLFESFCKLYFHNTVHGINTVSSFIIQKTHYFQNISGNETFVSFDRSTFLNTYFAFILVILIMCILNSCSFILSVDIRFYNLFYDSSFQTSIFIPAHGSVTSVTISSIDTAPDVITRLLDKFKVYSLHCFNSPKLTA